jgi:hypothetical protein
MVKKKSGDEPDQKDVAAIQNYLDWIDQAPAILKEDLEKIIEFILSAGEAYLPASKLSESDKEFRSNEIKQLDELRETLRILDLNIADNFLKTKIWRAVNLAMIAGNNLAQYGEPIPAVKGEIFIRQQSLKGKTSAAKRARDAAKGWQAVALKLAGMVRGIKPDISQEGVADYIRDHWTKHSNERRRGRRRLIELISHWESEGKLAKRVTQSTG